MSNENKNLSRRGLLRAASVAAGVVASGTSMLTSAASGATPDNAPTPAGRYRIDMHAHFLPPRYRESLLAHGHFLIGGYPLPEWSPEAAVSFMDDWGIQA